MSFLKALNTKMSGMFGLNAEKKFSYCFEEQEVCKFHKTKSKFFSTVSIFSILDDGNYSRNNGKLSHYPIIDSIEEAPEEIRKILIKHFNREETPVNDKRKRILSDLNSKFDSFEAWLKVEKIEDDKKKLAKQQQMIKAEREKEKNLKKREALNKAIQTELLEQDRRERQQKIRQQTAQLEHEDEEAIRQSEKDGMNHMRLEVQKKLHEQTNSHRKDLRQNKQENGQRPIKLNRGEIGSQHYGNSSSTMETFASVVQGDPNKSRYGEKSIEKDSNSFNCPEKDDITSRGFYHEKKQDQTKKEVKLVQQPQHIRFPSPEKPKRREKTVEEISEEIENIENEIDKAIVEVIEFKGNQQNKEYFTLDENLTQQLLKLDALSLMGNADLKSKRKEAIKKVKRALEMLEVKLIFPDEATENISEDHRVNGLKDYPNLIDFEADIKEKENGLAKENGNKPIKSQSKDLKIPGREAENTEMDYQSNKITQTHTEETENYLQKLHQRKMLKSVNSNKDFNFATSSMQKDDPTVKSENFEEECDAVKPHNQLRDTKMGGRQNDVSIPIDEIEKMEVDEDTSIKEQYDPLNYEEVS